MTVNAKVDLRPLATFLDAAAQALDAAVDEALAQAAEEVIKAAKERLSDPSGPLANSIVYDPASKVVVATSPYANFVEAGRGPIVAAPGRAIRLVINGETVFRRRVGPARARPFMGPAAQQGDRFLAQALEEALDGILS